MSNFKRWLSKPLGFSLLELMVVVAILGVLATVAVPRFNIFRARSRQAEAKTNLGVIFTLQESFAISHEQYYNGDASVWGGTDMQDLATADGYLTAGSSAVCRPNKLGFRLANCAKSRYAYWMAGANETEFLSIAFAHSDSTAGKRIFPGCNGGLGGRTSLAPGASLAGVDKCDTSFAGATGVTKAASDTGDAWCMDQNRALENYFDIVEGCDN